MYDPTRYKTAERVIPSDRAWFDGRLITAATVVTSADVVVQANVNTRLLTPDPARIWVGIFPGGGGLGTSNLGPWPDVDVFIFKQLTGLAPFTLTLFDSGSLVGAWWWIRCTGITTVRTVSVRRP